MRKLLLLIPALAAFAQTTAPRPRPASRPKLVVMIVVDQFRQDYFYRFGSEYTGGLAQLMKQGAFFTDAHYEHFPTVTAIGHSTVMSGATPSVSGIVGNEWYDRDLGRQVTSVFDPSVKALGASGEASSPHRLLVSTIADELKMSGRAPSKAIGISIKDRSAILPVGRMADGAYWFDNKTGNMVSSTYYFPDLPAWVQDFNKSRAADQWTGKPWLPFASKNAEPFLTMATPAGAPYWGNMQRSPFGNDLLELFAEKAVEAEKLGQGPGTDVLSVSFSSNDYVGHENGPDSPQVHDISVRTDRTLARLFQFLDAKVGLRNTIVAFTADHGVAPNPELMQSRKMPAGRISETLPAEKIEAAFKARYGDGPWVLGRSGPSPYLNHGLIRARHLSLGALQAEAAAIVREIPHIARVYTAGDLARGAVSGDRIDARLRNGYHRQRGADLFPVTEPFWTWGRDKATHGSPHHYDSHVPLVLMGPAVKPGRYHRRAAVNDIAPTVAVIVEVEAPSGSVGRVLEEALR
ncbi:MAG: alkaline phosphatase family protein [Bryobacteraceae bacterium]